MQLSSLATLIGGTSPSVTAMLVATAQRTEGPDPLTLLITVLTGVATTIGGFLATLHKIRSEHADAQQAQDRRWKALILALRGHSPPSDLRSQFPDLTEALEDLADVMGDDPAASSRPTTQPRAVVGRRPPTDPNGRVGDPKPKRRRRRRVEEE